MDPIVAVYSIHLTVRKAEGAPDVAAPASKAVEDACADAVAALIAPEGEITVEHTVTVNADAVRTDA